MAGKPVPYIPESPSATFRPPVDPIEQERAAPDYVIGTHEDRDLAEVQRNINNAIRRRAAVEWDLSKFTPELRDRAVGLLIAHGPDPKVYMRAMERANESATTGKPFRFDLGEPAFQKPYWKSMRASGKAGKVISALDTGFQQNIVPGRPTERLAANYILAPERFMAKSPSMLEASGSALRELAGQYVSGLASPAGALTLGIPSLPAKVLPQALKGIAGKSLLMAGTEAAGKTVVGKAVASKAGIAGRAVGNIPAPSLIKEFVRKRGGEVPETLGALIPGEPGLRWGKDPAAVAAKTTQEVEERTLQSFVDDTASDIFKNYTPEQGNMAIRLLESRPKKPLINLQGQADLPRVLKVLRKAGMEGEVQPITEIAAKLQSLQTRLGESASMAMKGSGEAWEPAIKRLAARHGRYGAKRMYTAPEVTAAEEVGPEALATGITETMRTPTMARRAGAGRPMLPPAIRVLSGGRQEARLSALLRAYKAMAANPAVSSAERVGERSLISTRETLPAYLQIPGSAEKYGAMAGRWANPHTAAQTMAMGGKLNVGNEYTRRFMNLFKKANTVMNLPVIASNKVTNLSAQNQVMSLPELLATQIQQHRFINKAGPEYQEAARLGLFQGTNNVDELLAELGKYRDVRGMESHLQGGGLMSKAMSGLYQATEQGDKAGLFLAGRRRGMSIPEAVDLAQKHLFNYQATPDFWKLVRSHPLGIPFLTFPTKATGLLAKTAATKPYQLRKMLIPSEAITKYNVDKGRLDMEKLEATKRARAALQRQAGNNSEAFMTELLPRTVVGSRHVRSMQVAKTMNPLRYMLLGGLQVGAPKGMPVQSPIINQAAAAMGMDLSGIVKSKPSAPEVVPDISGAQLETASDQGRLRQVRAIATLLGALPMPPVARGAVELAASPIPYQVARYVMAKRAEMAKGKKETAFRRGEQYSLFPADVPSYVGSTVGRTPSEIAMSSIFGDVRPDALKMLQGRFGMNQRMAPTQAVGFMKTLGYHGAALRRLSRKDEPTRVGSADGAAE